MTVSSTDAVELLEKLDLGIIWACRGAIVTLTLSLQLSTCQYAFYPGLSALIALKWRYRQNCSNAANAASPFAWGWAEPTR